MILYRTNHKVFRFVIDNYINVSGGENAIFWENLFNAVFVNNLVHYVHVAITA